MKRIVKTPAAKRDLIDAFVFIAEDNEQAAFRFLKAAEESFRDLAKMPLMGQAHEWRHPRLVDLRHWHVKGFENFLVFYRPLQGGVEIVRVIHGARDIERLLS